MNVSSRDRREVPIEGQSHWCDGWTADEERCYQIVSDDSDHCEAGHPNRIRAVPRDTSSGDSGAYADAADGLGSLSIEDVPPAQPRDVRRIRMHVQNEEEALVPDYDADRAVWEEQWDRWPSHTVEYLLRSQRDREKLEGNGFTDLEFAHPQDVVAVRVRDDATVRDGSILVPSTYRGRVGLAVRDTPVSGYEVLVRFGTGEYGSFFWSEFIKIALGPGGPPKSAVLTDNTREHRSQQERRPMAINAKGKNSIFASMAPDVKDALVKLMRSLKPVRISLSYRPR